MNNTVYIKEDKDTKIFVLDDSITKVDIQKEEDKIKLSVSYPFTTELLYAFSFKLNENGLPTEYAYFINGKEDRKEIKFKREFIETYIKDRKMIFNGSYYKMIN